MKKILLLTKTLLAAVLLCVGQNAWGAVGDKTTNLDIDFSNAISEGKVAGATGSMTIGGSNTAIADGILVVGNGTSSAALTGSAAGSGDQVEVTFDLAFGKLINKNVWFRLKDSEGGVIGEFNFYPYGGSLSTNTFGVALEDMYYASNTVIWERKVSFTITLNYKTRKITTATTCYKSGAGKSATNAEHTVDMTNSNPLAIFEIGSNYNNDGRRCSFDNLKVVTTEGEAATGTSYTVNYKLGDKVVKTVSNDGVVDQVVTADVAIDGTEEGYVGNHYLITAGVAPSMTLVSAAASNVLNVPVRAPYTATLTVTKNIGGEAQTPEVTNLVETDAKVCSWIYAYPMYIKKGDVYYIADVTSTFGETGNFTDGQSISKTVNYTATAPDVVWFKDIDGATLYNVAYSGGGYTNINEELANVTVDAGIYEVIFNVVSKAGSGSNHRNEGVSVNGENVANLTGNVNGLRSLIINVANDESVITAYGNGASSYTDDLDYVIIKKLPSTVSATIGANGFTTFASPYALDLTSATQTANSFKAYRASAVNDETVTFKDDVNQNVEANTGILLKGTANAVVSIPVVASGSALAENALQVNVAGTTFDAAPNTTYYGMNKDSNPLTFGTFDPSSVAIPANKAYLTITSGSGEARSIRVVFGDITGVANVEAAAEAKAQDGKFVENGKIVIVKNGVKYNAAGQQVK